ncbi:hypothetical protein KY337_00535 [Candidatus Woesearchaeota archaeon]|nr:hypothetical protein [Candidatus Woesearchaeota archaeon]
MKKTELERSVTYLLCPDKACRKHEESKSICEIECPDKDKLKKIVRCKFCDDIVYLPGTHYPPMKFAHICPDGRELRQFRLSYDYKIIYEEPE